MTRPPLPRPGPEPSELDQLGVLLVEEQLGLEPTSIEQLRRLVAHLPFEPCISLLSILAGKVEGTLNSADAQMAVAEEFFGPTEIVDRYRKLMASQPGARIFGPQSLYTLMRLLVEEAYDAPITQPLTEDERVLLLSSVVASNSVIEARTDAGVGPGQEDLLAYELQIGTYYQRAPWMEEMVRHAELYRLAAEDEALMRSPDVVPVQEWLERSGLTAHQQFLVGFGLSSLSNAWDPDQHPHVPQARATTFLERAVPGKETKALEVISSGRANLQTAFADLRAEGKRLIWELRPFNTWPFLRLQGDGGLLLLGRPWMVNWLGEGFHYRAMRVAQSEDRAAEGRSDHVQRYTAYAGQVFEEYCLRAASDALLEPALVLGEQSYGKGDGQKTSDVAVLIGDDLVLFEANARRVRAEPLISGDPLDATNELTMLIVKKIDQLGVSVAALLDGTASLPGVDMSPVKRIFPVVLAAGHVWQTSNLWAYLHRALDPAKCASFEDPRVQPLQLLDPSDYELLLALGVNGTNIADALGHKSSGPYRHRDFAVWLHRDPLAPDGKVRLPVIRDRFDEMTADLKAAFDHEEGIT